MPIVSVLGANGRANTYGNVVTITVGDVDYYYQNQLFVTKDNAIRDGLVLHYDSINNTGTHVPLASTWTDLQGSNHGAVTNGADWTGGDGGLHFNGMDERVAFAGDITSSYSIVMTIKPELVGFHPRLISERSFPTLYMNSNSHYRLALYSMNVDTQFSLVKAPSDMQNTYLVITYDQNSGVVTLYIDGVRAGAVTGILSVTAAIRARSATS